MSTDATTGEGPAPRIVRIGGAAASLLVAVVVGVTAWLAVSHQAWAPFGSDSASPDLWRQPLDAASALSARLQLAVAMRLPGDAVANGVAVAAVLGALVAAALVPVGRRAGLSTWHAALLAVVAAAAPLAQWQASSPLGSLPLTLFSVALLLWATRSPTAVAPWLACRSTALAGVLLALVVASFAWPHAPHDGVTAVVRLVRAELGLVGLVLVSANAFRLVSPRVTSPLQFPLLIGAIVIVATAPLAAVPRVAVLLPWLWWAVASGLAALLHVRATTHTARWAAVALSCWAAIHAAQVPWGQRRQAAALVRDWADGMSRVIESRQPWVRESSARGALLAALVQQRHGADAQLPASDVRAATIAGRRPLFADAVARDAWRWEGIGAAALPQPPGTSLHALLDALPPNTIVLAAISRDAAARLTPADWQALARVGVRQADAGQPRAHAIVGRTHVRVAGLHVASPIAARLDVQPGDPLGRIDGRSPLDARLEASADRVALTLRGRRLHEGPGALVLAASTRGDVLAWRSGPDASRLHGDALGRDAATVTQAAHVLPCVALSAGAPTDVTNAAQQGALSIVAETPSTLDLAVVRPPETVAGPFVEADTVPPGVTLQTLDAEHVRVRVDEAPTRVRLALRRRIARATATTTSTARLCGAWPMPAALDVAASPLVVDMTRDDAYLADGWHDRERAGDRAFRWMAGRRAALLVAVRDATAVQFAIDAQAPDDPRPGDAVTLTVNGRALPPLPIAARRARYAWTVPVDAWRAGLNTIEVATTRSVRPADRHPGTDGRTLGLALHGWTLGPIGTEASAIE